MAFFISTITKTNIHESNLTLLRNGSKNIEFRKDRLREDQLRKDQLYKDLLRKDQFIKNQIREGLLRDEKDHEDCL